MIRSKPIPAFNHEKFLSRIMIISNGCWQWKGFINEYGYGNFCIKNKNYKAHRLSFSLFIGELVNGMVIDHICKNKSCVNPEHLRQVTQKFNCLNNGESPSAINLTKTHCKRGHEFTPENTIKEKTGRSCRECKKNNKKLYNEKLKEKGRIRKLEKNKQQEINNG